MNYLLPGSNKHAQCILQQYANTTEQTNNVWNY